VRRAFTKSLLLDPRTLRALQQSVSDWRHERAAATNLPLGGWQEAGLSPLLPAYWRSARSTKCARAA
jgi:hypothetical protein